MGRQSARMILGLKDHKDIYFNGHYHSQMWLTDEKSKPTLMWEKLASEYFGLILKDTMIASDYGTGTPDGRTIYLTIGSADGNNLRIDWGDGTIGTPVGGLAEHTYPTSDGTEYQVKIYGKIGYFQAWHYDDGNYSSAVAGITTPLMATMTSNQYTQTNYTNIAMMFAYCKALKSLPDNLFENIEGSTYTDTRMLFAYSGLEHLPDNLFSDMNIRGAGVFEGCTELQDINPTIFERAEVESYQNMFRGCTSLVMLSSSLFATDKMVDFTRCFENCTALTAVPDNLFDYCPNIIRVDYCFSGCYSIITEVPRLWEREWYNSDYYEDCYYWCYNAANYEEIPIGWR